MVEIKGKAKQAKKLLGALGTQLAALWRNLSVHRKILIFFQFPFCNIFHVSNINLIIT